MKKKLHSCLFLIGLGIVSHAHATTFNVDSTSDGVDNAIGDNVCATVTGECSLRAAVQEANTQEGEDTIVIPEGTYLLTDGATGEDLAAGGDLDITDKLVIEGVGQPIIDGSNRDNVFTVFSPTKINGITIQNGINGIYLKNSSSVLLNSVVIQNNTTGIGSHPNDFFFKINHSRQYN